MQQTRPIFHLFLLSLAVLPALVSRGQGAPVETGTLTFTCGGHVAQFGKHGYRVASTDHALAVEFVNSREAGPVSGGNGAVGQGAGLPAGGPRADGPAGAPDPLDRVTYPGLWDKVTAIYQGTKEGILESVYVLEPDGDSTRVGSIVLQYNRPVSLDKAGNLVIGYNGGELTESAPVAWQEVNGQKRPVAVSYRLYPGNRVGFRLGKLIPGIAVTIDPSLSWNTFLGAYYADYCYSIATDQDGYIYVAGYSNSTWGQPVRAFGGGNCDGFVAKLSPTGSLVWNAFLGGASSDYCYGLAVDQEGYIYAAGSSFVTWGQPVRAFSGYAVYDGFVAKLSPAGSLVWNTFLGGTSYDDCYGIAIDQEGYIYAAGISSGTWGQPVRAFSVSFDGFVVKLSPAGSLLWNTFLGGTSSDLSNGGIAVDQEGYTYVAGQSSGTWGETPVRAYGGGGDGFVAKISPAGSLVWNTFLGSTATDYGYGIAVDQEGYIYAAGFGNATWGETPVQALSGSYDGFIAKLSPAGNLLWYTFLGGSSSDQCCGIAVDQKGYIYTAGISNATWGETPLPAYSGGSDSFVAKLSPAGSLVWNAFLGGSGNDQVGTLGRDITIDQGGNILVCGYSTATWGSPVRSFSANGSNTDGFVYSLSPRNDWKGMLSADWGTTGNWTEGSVPLSGESVYFDPSPQNNLVMDQDRTIGSLGNSQSVYRLVANGHTLTVGGSLALTGGAQIDASAPSSGISFSGSAAQAIPAGAFYNNEVYNLTIANSNNVTLGGDLSVTGALTATSGALDVTVNSPTLTFSGSAAQTLSSGALLSNKVYNLTINNSNNVTLDGDLTLTGALTSVSGGLDATANSPAFTFGGSAAQEIPEGAFLDNTAYNLTIDNAAGVTDNTDLSVGNNLVISSRSSLTVAADKSLSVDGTLTNSAGGTGLVLASGATGVGSLLYAGTGVSGTVNRYIGPDESWKFISSPVSGQAIFGSNNWTPSGSYGDGTGYDLYAWDEPGSCWIYNLNTDVDPTWSSVQAGDQFTPGRGYLYSLETAGTNSFIGTLTSGSVDYAITASGTGTNDEGSSSYTGFNLVGNPYPSAIDWAADAGYTRDMLTPDNGGYNAWIWSATNSNYGVINSADADGEGTNGVGRYIAPTEGFFVQAASAGTFTFNNNCRVNANGGMWVESAATGIRKKTRFKVKSLSGLGADEVWFDLGNGENAAGARKLFSVVKTAPSLYLRWNSDTLTTLHLTDTTENKTVNLGFSAGQAGSYRLTCNPSGAGLASLYLKDRLTGRVHDFSRDTVYTFSAKAGDAASRFVLSFSAGTDENDRGEALVYMNGDELEVDLEGLDSDISYEVGLHDVKGRLLGRETLKGGSAVSYPLNTRGIYLVKVKGGGMDKGYKVVY